MRAMALGTGSEEGAGKMRRREQGSKLTLENAPRTDIVEGVTEGLEDTIG